MAAVGSVHDEAVPPLIHKAAAWAWRLLVIIGLAVALLWVIQRLEVILVPVALALMLTALMIPAVDFLDRRGAPRGGAVALVLLSGVAIVGGILTFVVSQFVTGLPGLVEQVTQSIDTARTWLIEGPAHLSKDQITNAGNSAIEALRNNQEKLTSGALSTAATVTEIAGNLPIGLPAAPGGLPTNIPTGVGVGTSGTIYFSSDIENAIYKVTKK
jgi:predicted PurR-regulated permease PerM